MIVVVLSPHAMVLSTLHDTPSLMFVDRCGGNTSCKRIQALQQTASPSYMISRAGIKFNVASVRVEQTLQYPVVASDVCMITPSKNTFFVWPGCFNSQSGTYFHISRI